MKYIHIGFSRTGTTWLQKLVFPEWMKANNVAFFNFIEQPDFHQKPSDKILISTEYIGAHPLLTDTVENALFNMIGLFGDVKVIISNRKPQEVADSINDTMRCSFRVNNMLNGVPLRILTKEDVSIHQANVFAWLFMNKVPFLEININYFDKHSVLLANFMEIEPPTGGQIQRWMAIRINKRFPKWLLIIVKTLHKWKWHRIRKTVLLINLICRKL